MGVMDYKNELSTEMPIKNELSATEEGTMNQTHRTDLHRDLKARHITMIGRPPRCDRILVAQLY